jgi:hypothetical protein
MEYQKQEGYCAPTTVRVILKSIPSIPSSAYPPMKSGGAVPEQVVENIDSCGFTRSRVVLASEGFEAFLKSLKLVNDTRYRVSANFLRSSLFGMPQPFFLPHNFLLGLFGGHFSPVIGYLEDQNLVKNYLFRLSIALNFEKKSHILKTKTN